MDEAMLKRLRSAQGLASAAALDAYWDVLVHQLNDLDPREVARMMAVGSHVGVAAYMIGEQQVSRREDPTTQFADERLKGIMLVHFEMVIDPARVADIERKIGGIEVGRVG